MAAAVTRHYNLGPEQLTGAMLAACRECFPRIPPLTWPEYVSVRTGLLRWPLTSYGEHIELQLTGPGTVRIASSYVMPTQVAELGDNAWNVVRLAKALDRRCAALAPACPACGAPVAVAQKFCTACGQAQWDTVTDDPLPNARRIRAVALLLVLAVAALVIGGMLYTFAFLSGS